MGPHSCVALGILRQFLVFQVCWPEPQVLVWEPRWGSSCLALPGRKREAGLWVVSATEQGGPVVLGLVLSIQPLRMHPGVLGTEMSDWALGFCITLVWKPAGQDRVSGD